MNFLDEQYLEQEKARLLEKYNCKTINEVLYKQNSILKKQNLYLKE
ncbi:MAG: hypothetical protein ACOCRX_05785 [Candidatus Woesearchaeota archaeon]